MIEKEKAFIISDIHGKFAEFTKLLESWNREEELLILNGDLVDRGGYSREVLNYALMLMHEEGAVVNWGNHDRMLWDFLTTPIVTAGDIEDLWQMYSTWYYQGGRETSSSILGMSIQEVDSIAILELRERLLAHSVVKDLMELMTWYYEFGKVLVVHAGIPIHHQEHWQRTPREKLIWERGFHVHPNKTGKVIVSGHTPLQNIHDSTDIWVNKEKDIYMIDGGCAYGGQLNAIVMDKEGNLIRTHKEKMLK